MVGEVGPGKTGKDLLLLLAAAAKGEGEDVEHQRPLEGAVAGGAKATSAAGGARGRRGGVVAAHVLAVGEAGVVVDSAGVVLDDQGEEELDGVGLIRRR